MAQSTLLINNNATSTLAGAITPTALTAQLAAGTGVLFPNPGASQYFVMTFTNATTLVNEIVHVTALTGDTVTMVRAQEGTEALSWNAGDLAQNLITAGTFGAFLQNTASLPISYAGNPNGHVAGTQGSPGTNGIPTICFDVTNLIGYFCSTTGTASTAVWSPMSGQAVQFAGGASTGTAAAQVLSTVTPGGFSLVAGYSVTFVSGFNSVNGGTQLNIAGTGLTTAEKVSGGSLTAITTGDMTANDPVSFTYNGTVWVLGTAAQGNIAPLNIGFGLKNDGAGNLAVAAIGSSHTRGLKITNNSGTQNTKIDITLLSATLLNSSGQPIHFGSSSFTIDLTTGTSVSAANGMDGENRPNSGFVYLYAISNGTLIAGLASTVSSNPTLPSGYTFAKYIGAMYCDSAANLMRTLQYGARTQYVLTGGTNTAALPVAASGAAGNPLTPTWVAATVQGNGYFVPTTAGTIIVAAQTVGNTTVTVAPNGSYGATSALTNPPPATIFGGGDGGAFAVELILESAAVYWANNQAISGQPTQLAVLGWNDYCV